MRINNTYLVLLSLFIISCASNEDHSPIYPSYGPEKLVNIDGLTFDAMEPFLSPDGNYLFFNNLNDGINTKLFYATRINDSTFHFTGEISGTNQSTPPHLDAVADMDEDGNFYWTSTRNYPAELNNLFTGTFSNGIVTNIARVQGDFNMNIPGWLVMDHGISLDGQFLYFNHARFDEANCQGPCETEIGIAKKNPDLSFTKLANSASVLQNINNENYIYYAPCISSDNLEFYFTRYLKGQITQATVFEICVAVRSDSSKQFSVPKVLFSETISDIIEAPTLSVDKKIIYYHKKISGTHQIMMRYRK